MDTVHVSTMSELKDAVKQKRERIVVDGKLANKLSILAKVKDKPDVHPGMSTSQLAGSLAGVAAVPVAVWITLIIATGVTVIVGLLLGYNLKVKVGDNELVFDKK
ncbi:MAG: hypothetical protein LPK26_21085 [Bacillaceae bacterium]|nr:hypothetical protein [Bacillaceae bacterium]